MTILRLFHRSYISFFIFFSLLINTHLVAQSLHVLNPIVVTATKYATPTDRLIEPIRVITSEEIDAYGWTSFQEVLSTVSSVSFSDAGGTKAVFFRGIQHSAANKILLNGIDLKDAIGTNGAAYLNTLSIQDIDRIEIVSGSLGTLHGSGAMSGVINIITKKETPFRYRTSAGQDYLASTISGGVSIGDLSLFLSGHYLNDVSLSKASLGSEKDRKSNTGVSIQSTLPFATETAANEWSAFVQKNNLIEALDGFGAVDKENYDVRADQWVLNTKLSSFWSTELNSVISYGLQTMSRHYTDDRADFGQTEILDFMLNYSKEDDYSALFGIDFQREKASSKSQWEDFPLVAQRVNGVYSKLSFFNTLFPIHLGVRKEDYFEKSVFTYAAGAQVPLPWDKELFKLNYSTGYREPTLYERFSSAGDQALSAETSETLAFGYHKTATSYKIETVYFIQSLSNRIDWESTDPSTFEGVYSNVSGKIKSSGIEVSFDMNDIFQNTSFGLDYTRLSSTMSDGSKPFRIPDQKLTLRSTMTYAPISIGLSYHFIDDRLDFGNVTLESYQLFNMNFLYRPLTNMTLGFTLHNVFNEQYETASGYASPNRCYRLSIEQQF